MALYAHLKDHKMPNANILFFHYNSFLNIHLAWNLALQCEEQPERMKELYILCSQLLSLGPLDDTTLSRQMMCMLMSAATCLQVAGTTNDDRVGIDFMIHIIGCMIRKM